MHPRPCDPTVGVRRRRVRPGRVHRARRAVERRRCSRRSAAAIPGGVNSSIRAFKAVGGAPYLVARAEGPYVFDVEGRRYIDLVQSYGAVILGHAHPAVTAARARRPPPTARRTARRRRAR